MRRGKGVVIINFKQQIKSDKYDQKQALLLYFHLKEEGGYF